MAIQFRCNCPFTSALDVLGDRWLLVLVKLMLIEGKDTFKALAESDESIATNILSSKLKILEEVGVIRKVKPPHNQKTNLYLLTERGIALAPLLVELATWSDQQLRSMHPGLGDGEGLALLRKDKKLFAQVLQEKYRDKLAATAWENPTN